MNPVSLVLLALAPSIAWGHMHGGGGSVGNQMIPHLHFTHGDALWFAAWAPSSHGAIVAACIALFLLAIFERLVVASRGVLEGLWHDKAVEIRAQYNLENATEETPLPTYEKRGQNALPTSGPRKRPPPPFIPTNDVSRAIIQTCQSALQFLFMLTVMTWNVSYIISLVVGLGVGQTLFGRFALMSTDM